MRFTYTYRSSDGQRHAGEIEAESRDAAFGKIRAELGVKPIRVVTAGGGEGESGESGNSGISGTSGTSGTSGNLRMVAAAVLTAAAIAGGAWWWAAARHGDREQPPAQFTVNTPQGPITYRIADPLPRQTIPGNRQRIEAARESSFTNAAERLLARFAEPGRNVAAPAGETPTEAEFAACLREPVRVASTDFTEAVDLKRIVAGLKREMRAYLAGGGTVEQYLSELARRQKLEISYRERAEQKLASMLGAARQEAGKTASTQQQDGLREAYGYWLKANAQLQAMGIYPLAMPDALRSYQMGLDIEE